MTVENTPEQQKKKQELVLTAYFVNSAELQYCMEAQSGIIAGVNCWPKWANVRGYNGKRELKQISFALWNNRKDTHPSPEKKKFWDGLRSVDPKAEVYALGILESAVDILGYAQDFAPFTALTEEQAAQRVRMCDSLARFFGRPIGGVRYG